MSVRPDCAHVASFLRSEMTKRNMTVFALNGLLGIEKHSTTAYNWLNAKAIPKEPLRQKLSKIFNVSEETFMPKEPSKLKTAIVEYKSKPQVNKTEPLSFKMLGNDTAQIQFNAVLPIDQAKILMKFILECNIK
jgi:transcriptional regulator with XRE-family HTH domain